ncbi:hypothetical protein [Microviridae sp.]|nr:hypothetical protein [Microviridae sp.]
MDWETGSQIATAAGGVVSDIANLFGRKKREKRQIGYQKEMADYKYQKDMEMWEKQQAYNLPSAQMKRLKDAGINPQNVFGGGQVSGNVATSTPDYQATTPVAHADKWSMPNALGIMQQYQNLRNTKQQTNNLSVQNGVIQQEKLLKIASTASKKAQTAYTNAQKDRFNKISEDVLKSAQYSAQIAEEELKHKKHITELQGYGLQTSDNVILRALVKGGKESANAIKNWLNSGHSNLQPYQGAMFNPDYQ